MYSRDSGFQWNAKFFFWIKVPPRVEGFLQCGEWMEEWRNGSKRAPGGASPLSLPLLAKDLPPLIRVANFPSPACCSRLACVLRRFLVPNFVDCDGGLTFAATCRGLR